MPVKQIFQNQPDIIASYDFTDFVTNQTYVKFYPYVSYDSSGLYYGMTSNVDTSSIRLGRQQIGGTGKYSVPHIESQTNYTGASAGSIDLTFNSPLFRTPQIINGTLIATIPYTTDIANSGIVTSVVINLYLYKNDGSTQTQIATVSTSAASAVIGTSGSNIQTVELSIPKTKINPDDYLQFRVDVDFSITSGSGTNYSYLGHDPLNRDGEALTPSTSTSERTRMEVMIPFEVVE